MKHILKAIVATFLYILGIQLVGVWQLLAEWIGLKNIEEYYSFIQVTLQALLVIVFIRYYTKTNLRSLPQPSTHRRLYLLAIVFGALIIFIQSPLDWTFNALSGTEYSFTYRFDGWREFGEIKILTIVFFGPIGEELFFRQYLQKSLQDAFKPVFAIVIASLMFALLHAPYMSLFFDGWGTSWYRFCLTFMGGLLSGYLFYKSKSIGPSILMHMVWNSRAVLV